MKLKNIFSVLAALAVLCVGAMAMAAPVPSQLGQSREAMVIEERKAVNCVHNCILCGVCISKCPEKAIRYGRKDDEE